MKTTAKIKIGNLKQGSYAGLWGGYEVVVGKTLLTTNDGIRGMNIPVTVDVVSKDNITITTK